MTTDLPDPHGCHFCGHLDIAIKWGEPICGMCHAPRRHAEPGCPVRNVMACEGGGWYRTAWFPMATATVLRHDPTHGRARLIWEQQVRDANGGGSWFATEVVR